MGAKFGKREVYGAFTCPHCGKWIFLTAKKVV